MTGLYYSTGIVIVIYIQTDSSSKSSIACLQCCIRNHWYMCWFCSCQQSNRIQDTWMILADQHIWNHIPNCIPHQLMSFPSIYWMVLFHLISWSRYQSSSHYGDILPRIYKSGKWHWMTNHWFFHWLMVQIQPHSNDLKNLAHDHLEMCLGNMHRHHCSTLCWRMV